jgi:hypothetical protein
MGHIPSTLCFDFLFGICFLSFVIYALASGRSAVRLAHLLWEQGVVSSNLTAPTLVFKQFNPVEKSDFFVGILL